MMANAYEKAVNTLKRQNSFSEITIKRNVAGSLRLTNIFRVFSVIL